MLVFELFHLYYRIITGCRAAVDGEAKLGLSIAVTIIIFLFCSLFEVVTMEPPHIMNYILKYVMQMVPAILINISVLCDMVWKNV